MRRFILGTDWWTDCDDAVAMRLVARAVKRGEIGLLGIAINAAMEYSVPSLDGFWRREGVEVPPIGIDREAVDFGGRPPYQARLAAYSNGRTNADAEDAVKLYRRLLAEAEQPVEIMEIGYLNAVAALLTSGGDEFSPLDGRTLVAQKVSHMWVMAGQWDREVGRENNFARNARAATAAHAFCRHCPVPVTFLGYEVGDTVKTGGELEAGDHLHDVLCDHRSPHGRWSWDPMLVSLALVGDAEAAGYRQVTGKAEVDAETGENRFTQAVDGPHSYVIKARDDRAYEQQINKAIASET